MTGAVGLETGAGAEALLETEAVGLETEAEETEKREEIEKLTSGRTAGHSSITWSSTAEDSVGVVRTLSRAVLYGVGSDVGSVGSGSGT